jgi:CubicO group peptidase (beta-lactamase class C family)
MFMYDQISQFLQERVDAGDFPSAVYLVAEKGQIVFQGAVGHAVVDPQRISATSATIYDLASLTKPLITGLLAAKLIEDNEISADDSIGDHLNEFYVSSNAEISIIELLTHTSGLPSWRPFYLLVEHPEDVLTEIAETLSGREQEPVTYSDLNFLTLQNLIERILDDNFADITDREIISKLGLSKTFFNPLRSATREAIAASEFGNEYEKNTCVELGYLKESDNANCLRDYQIWGEVHDGNAWFMGGVAGHAGLFSTAQEVFKIALQFLPNHTNLLKLETAELFRTNFTEGMNEDRSIAFQLASTEGSTAGMSMSPQSFGHNGFTGTSLWIDPINDRIFILLTNRTHAHPLPFVNINSVRRKFHDLAIAELDKNS